MAKKTKEQRLADRLASALIEDDEEEIEQVITAEEALVYDKYAKIRAALGGSSEQGRVKLQRRSKDGTIKSLYSMPFDGFSEDAVALRYGGGLFICRFYKGDELLGVDTFEIEGEPRTWRPEEEAAAPAMGGKGMALDPMTALMVGRMQGLEALLASNSKTTEALMLALVGSRNTEREKDPLDVGLKIAALLKEASSGVERLGIKDMAETFRDGLNMGRAITSPEEGLGTVVDKLLPSVTSTLDNLLDIERQKRGMPPAMTPRLPPGGATTGPASAPRADPEPTGATMLDLSKAPWLIHLRPFIKEIEQGARTGWSPESYVQFMISRMPDNILDEIEAAAKADPEFTAHALAALPAPFRAYTAWLTKALDALKVQVQQQEGRDEEEETGAGGTP